MVITYSDSTTTTFDFKAGADLSALGTASDGSTATITVSLDTSENYVAPTPTPTPTPSPYTPPHTGQTKVFEQTGTGLNLTLTDAGYGPAINIPITGWPGNAVNDLITIVIAGSDDTAIAATNNGLKAMPAIGNPWTTLMSWNGTDQTLVAGPLTAGTAFSVTKDETLTVASASTNSVVLQLTDEGGSGTPTYPAEHLTLTKFQIWK